MHTDSVIIIDDAAKPSDQVTESHYAYITKPSTPTASYKGMSQLEGDCNSDSTIIYTPISNCKGIEGEKEYDSDTTNLGTQTAACSGAGGEDTVPLISSPTVNYKKTGSEEGSQNADSDSSGSYIETYMMDPTYDGPAYASQPCGKHGASYTPPGWKRILVKRRKSFLMSSTEMFAFISWKDCDVTSMHEADFCNFHEL